MIEIVFAVVLDLVAIVVAVLVARHLRRRPLPQQNYRPSLDDARSGRRVTLFIYPKGTRSKWR